MHARSDRRRRRTCDRQRRLRPAVWCPPDEARDPAADPGSAGAEGDQRRIRRGRYGTGGRCRRRQRAEFRAAGSCRAAYQEGPCTSRNAFKTVLLLGCSAASSWLEERRGRPSGPRTWGWRLAVVMNFVSYFFSEKIALSMYSAQPVTRGRESGSLPARRADGPQPGAAHGAAHAEALADSGRFAQRLRHRAQSVSTPRWRSPPASCG